jgi:hypothetical protein
VNEVAICQFRQCAVAGFQRWKVLI